MPGTKVILASSTHPDYSFPVGIAALLWRDVVGYSPYVFQCANDWSLPTVTIPNDFMREMGIEACRIRLLDEWPIHVTAQHCRYHAAAGSFHDDEWLMLSDADLFPLKRDFYHQHEDYAGRFAFYYSNGDNGENYPTCHIAARAKDWRDVMKLDTKDNICGSMRRNLEGYLRPKIAGLSPAEADFRIWVNDMHMFREWIGEKPWHPAECKMIEREGHPPKDRLDRSAWPASYDASKFVDAHILKEPSSAANWPRLRPIVEQLIPQHLARIDRFVEDFRSA